MEMKKKTFLICLCSGLFLMLFNSGCVMMLGGEMISSTSFETEKATIKFTSTPEKVDVYDRAGTYLGQTPFEMQVPYRVKVLQKQFSNPDAVPLGITCDLLWTFFYGAGLVFLLLDLIPIEAVGNPQKFPIDSPYYLRCSKPQDGYEDAYLEVACLKENTVHIVLEKLPSRQKEEIFSRAEQSRSPSVMDVFPLGRVTN